MGIVLRSVMTSHIRSLTVAAMICAMIRAMMVVSAGADEIQAKAAFRAARLDPALTGAQ
jgi:hypothetical protein